MFTWLTQNPSVDMGINSNKTSPTKKLTSIYGKSESLLSKEKRRSRSMSSDSKLDTISLHLHLPRRRRL